MKSLNSLLTALVLAAAAVSMNPTFARAEPAVAAPAPAEMLTNGSFSNGLAHWDLEQNAKATGLADTAPEGPNNAPALRIKVLTLGDAPWQLQTYQKGLRVEKGKTYTFSFSAKSDRPGDITVNCMQNHAPWDHHTQQVIALTPEWQQIKYEFTAPWDDDNVRVGFTNLATTPGQTYWFTNCSLTPNPPAPKAAPQTAPKSAPSSALPATTPPTAAAQTAAATTTPPPANLTVWDGEQAEKGGGWVNPTTCSIASQSAQSHSGKSAIEFKFKGDGPWLGAGWNWCAFETGPVGTDISAMKNLTFWVKSAGSVSDLQLNLLCGGQIWDTPEHHTEKVSVLKYCPDLQDGKWHKVTIPLADLTQPPGFDPRNVGELQVFNAGPGDGSYFFDDIAFDDGSATTPPAPPSH